MEKEGKLIQTILKRKKLQQVSQDCLGIIIPGSWIRAMGWDRKTIFILQFQPLGKGMILKEIGREEVSDTEPGTD